MTKVEQRDRDAALVEELARAQFCLNEDMPIDQRWTNASVNYWFSCTADSPGEDRDCWAHCDELRANFRELLPILANAIANGEHRSQEPT